MTPDFLSRASKVVPGASSTNAKSPFRMPVPLFAERASGCTFRDRELRQWVDWDMALGAVIWGHARPEISEAIIRQCSDGIIFSAPAVLEIEVAERILDRLQVFESLRFFKTGSEATSAALRIARAAIGRHDVVCATYHGWHDWAAYHHYGGKASLGIPEPRGVRWVTEETAAAFSAHLQDAAAAIVCPEHWQIDQLRELRARCDREGAVLIFDEVKSGMRYSRRGVFGEFGITPDLICMSKGVANGLPLAFTAGNAALMRRAYSAQVSGTYGGDCISLAAATASEVLLARCEEWPPWRTPAAAVINELKRAIDECGAQLQVEGYPGCFRLRGRDGIREHLAARGMFSSGWVIPSAAHQPEHYSALTDALVQFIKK